MDKAQKTYLSYAPNEGYKEYDVNGAKLIDNTFVGKYVAMYSETAQDNIGNIPDPNNNSAISSPTEGCSLTLSGELNSTEVGNCDVSSTYCRSEGSNGSFKWDASNPHYSNWRIIYVENLYSDGDLTNQDYSNKKSDAIFYLVTAKSPECSEIKSYGYTLEEANAEKNKLDSLSAKYCNDSLVDGKCQIGVNIRTLYAEDFKKISNFTKGRRNISVEESFYGCGPRLNHEENKCFYTSKDYTALANNPISLVTNGEYYILNEFVLGSSWYECAIWNRYRIDNPATYPANFGLRPVLKLKAGIQYIKGTGSSDDPYLIVP